MYVTKKINVVCSFFVRPQGPYSHQFFFLTYELTPINKSVSSWQAFSVKYNVTLYLIGPIHTLQNKSMLFIWPHGRIHINFLHNLWIDSNKQECLFFAGLSAKYNVILFLIGLTRTLQSKSMLLIWPPGHIHINFSL